MSMFREWYLESVEDPENAIWTESMGADHAETSREVEDGVRSRMLGIRREIGTRRAKKGKDTNVRDCYARLAEAADELGAGFQTVQIRRRL